MALLLALFFAPVPGGAFDKKPPAPSAMLAGTVFRDAGFALRGAEVVVTPDSAGKKAKPLRAASDARGEFFLRLPPGPASYNVVVRASGYKPAEKKVTFGADERLDINFLLEPDGTAGGEKK